MSENDPTTQSVVEAAINKYKEHAEQHGPRSMDHSGCYCRLCNAVDRYLKERLSK